MVIQSLLYFRHIHKKPDNWQPQKMQSDVKTANHGNW